MSPRRRTEATSRLRGEVGQVCDLPIFYHQLRRACAFLVLCAVVAYAQQRQMTVPQLVSFIKSSIQLRQDDRQVAEVVHRIKLTNRLDGKTIEQLEGMGAGPRTVVALKQL